MKNRFTLIIALSLFTLATQAQYNTNTIDQQFNTLMKQSPNWQKSKVIELEKLQNFRNSINDSLNKLQATIDQNEVLIDKSKEQLDTLSLQLQSTRDSLSNSALHYGNEINILGINTKKSTFLTLNWLIIGLLSLSLIIFIYRSKICWSEMRQAKIKLLDTEEELEDLRKSSLEREQKIRRQLQDEINKNKPVETEKKESE